jgi:hypothetical protein
MGTFHIEKRKIEGVQDITARALLNQGFSSVEILMGLSEFIGRLAVMEGSTPIQMQELIELAADHMLTTTQIGAEARGFSRPDSEEIH